MLINIGIILTYIMIGLGVLAILLFAVKRLASHPEAAKAAGIGIVGLIVLMGLSYVFSTGDDALGMFKKHEITEGTSRMIGTGLVSFYLLVGLAILSILYVEVTRLFK